jgi:hypothetical protein
VQLLGQVEGELASTLLVLAPTGGSSSSWR